MSETAASGRGRFFCTPNAGAVQPRPSSTNGKYNTKGFHRHTQRSNTHRHVAGKYTDVVEHYIFRERFRSGLRMYLATEAGRFPRTDTVSFNTK
jgi:hypothetical protein